MLGRVDREIPTILASAVAGDDAAFAAIVRAHHPAMYGICVLICRDRQMAEEAVHSAWSIAWRKLGSVREPERLRPWLVAVAVNEAKQSLRRKRHRAKVEVVLDPGDRPGGIDPATGIAGMDLRAAMARLDADDRALLAMRYVFGFDANELSTAIGLSPPATRQRLHRLLQRLRKELER